MQFLSLVNSRCNGTEDWLNALVVCQCQPLGGGLHLSIGYKQVDDGASRDKGSNMLGR